MLRIILATVVASSLSYDSPSVGGWNGYLDGGNVIFSTDSDGVVNMTNSAGQGIEIDLTTDGELYLKDESGASLDLRIDGAFKFAASTYAITVADGYLRLGAAYGAAVRAVGDDAVDGNAMLDVYFTNAAWEMTASSGTQYGYKLSPNINQSGTAAFKGFYMNVTDNASGSGQDYAMDLNWGGAPVLQVLDDGAQLPKKVLSTGPTEPFTCDSTHEGSQVYVDDQDDTAYARVCVCANLDGTGYDWRDIGDIVGTACPFF